MFYCIMEREYIHKLCSTKFFSEDGNKARRVHLALSGLDWWLMEVSEGNWSVGCFWTLQPEVGGRHVFTMFGISAIPVNKLLPARHGGFIDFKR